MGMKRKKCPACGKHKRWCAGRQRARLGRPLNAAGREDGWAWVDEQLVCPACASKNVDAKGGAGV